MADAKITITADAQEAKASLEELRGVAATVFDGIRINTEKAAEATESLAQGWHETGVTLSEAKEAVGQLRPVVAESASKADEFGGIIEKAAGRLAGIGLAISVAKQNLSDFKAEMGPAIEDLKDFAVEAGLSRDSVDNFARALEAFTNPGTIFKNFLEIHKSLMEDALIAAGRLKEGELDAIEATKEYERAHRATAESLAARSTAIVALMDKERENGAVTGQTRVEVEKLLKEYQQAGVSVPEYLDAARESLGLLTDAQEDAAKAAEKAAKEAEKAAEKQAKAAEQQAKAVQDALDKKAAALAAETAALEKNYSAEEKLIPKLTEFAEGKKAGTAAVDDSVRALKEELSILEQAAKAAEDAAKSAGARASQAAGRIAELEGKPVLTIEEQNELNDLKAAQVDIDNEAADAADNAAQATFEYGAAQAELGESTDKASESLDYASGVMAELEAATSAYGAAIANVGDEAQSTTAYVEAVGEDGTKFWTNFTDTVVGGNEALGDTGAALGDISDVLPDTADGLYQVGDALKQIDAPTGDGEDKGLEGVAKDAKTLAKELLPEILRLCKEIREEAGAITLGGAGGGI